MTTFWSWYITLLTVGFGVPIHTALAVALASMVFTMLSGAVSHFREHEIILRTGAVIGLGGIIGAFVGANTSNLMPAEILSFMTALMISLSAIILYTRLYHAEWLARHFADRARVLVRHRELTPALTGAA